MADFEDYEPRRVDQFSELSSVTDNDLLYVEKASDSRGHRVKAKNILPDGAVTSDKLATHSVTGMKIAPNAVGNDAIAAGVVNTQHITPYAVTTEKLANKAVTNLKIAADAVGNAELADGAVTESKIAPLNVTTGKIASNAVTSEKLSSDLQNTIANKANIDGYYDEMAVGSAEQLLSNTYEEDSDPYLFRTSGGSLEIGDRVYEDAIVGASMAWNQLVQNGDFASSNGWSGVYATISVANNVCTLTPQNNINCRVQHSLVTNTTHKYLFMAMIKPSASTSVVWAADNSAIQGLPVTSMTANVWNNYSSIANAGAVSANFNLFVNRDTTLTSEDTVEIKNVQIFDLTLALGSTIADYAYTLETSEAGSGISWLKSQGFFTKDYYAYNAGGIESVKTSAKKVTGFNQWNGITENGYFDPTTGAPAGESDIYVRCKNPIKAMPNTQYYIKKATGPLRVLFYDLDGVFISASSGDVANSVITTPNNCYFIKWYCLTSTYSEGSICINFHWDGERDGEYEAYEERTYPLGNDELRGLYKLSNGKIYADGDVKTSDGVITRKYGIVDLGTLDWVYFASTNPPHFGANVDGLLSRTNNIICSRYETIADNPYGNANETIRTTNEHTATGIKVSDADYSDATAFKTAMSGQYLVYELATTTTESADPYTNPQWVDNWGTEEFVDTRDVPVPVGHESRYLPDLKAKLESAPNNPSTNGKYFLQYQNGEATYVPVPSEVPQTPSEDGTYVLKAIVASGVATLSWVAEE